MDWKAQLASSIEASVHTAVEAAVQRYVVVEESAEETARRRTMSFGEAGRRRIELEEERVRRDPVWAEKMARRHAAFRAAHPLTAAPAMAATTWAASALLEPDLSTTMPDTGMATSTSITPASILTAGAVRDCNLAARTPTTCSTIFPSRATTSSVSGLVSPIAPPSSTTTTFVLPELTAPVVSEEALTTDTTKGAVATPTICSTVTCSPPMAITCSTECPGEDNSAAVATAAPSESMTSIIPVECMIREVVPYIKVCTSNNTMSAASAASKRQWCDTELCDEQPCAQAAVSSSDCDDLVSLTGSEALTAVSWRPCLFLEEDYTSTRDKCSSISWRGLLGTCLVTKDTFKFCSSVYPEHLSHLFMKCITQYVQCKWLHMSLVGHCLVSSFGRCFTQAGTALVYMSLLHCVERNPWPPPSNKRTACRFFNLHSTLFSVQISGYWLVMQTVKLTWSAALIEIIFVLEVQIAQLKPTIFKWSDPFCFDTHLLGSSSDLSLANMVWNLCYLDTLHCSLGNINWSLHMPSPATGVFLNCDFARVHFQWAITVQKWNSRHIWQSHTPYFQLIEWFSQSEFGFCTPGNILFCYCVLMQWEIPWTVILASQKCWFQYCSPGHEYPYGYEIFWWTIAWSVSSHLPLSRLLALSSCVSPKSERSGMDTIRELSSWRYSEQRVFQMMLKDFNPFVCQEPILLHDCFHSCFNVHIIQFGFEVIQWKIVWSLNVQILSCGYQYLISGTASTVLLQLLDYVVIWSSRCLEYCQGKFSWDPGIWSLLCFFGFFTPAEAKGRSNATGPAYYTGHCLGHAYYFDKVRVDQDYYVTVFRPGNMGHDYLDIFLEHAHVVCYLNLSKVCHDYNTQRNLGEVMKHQIPWDRDGLTCHRLEVKPKFKEWGMLATMGWTMGCLSWAWAYRKPQKAATTYTMRIDYGRFG